MLSYTSAVASRTDIEGRHLLLGIVKRCYAIHGTRLRVADEQVPVRIVPDAGGPLARMKKLVDDSDALPPKPATDVVVTGTVHAPAPTPRLRVGVAAGRSARQLELFGPRRIDVGADGVPHFTAPTPFEALELNADNAYGGCDTHALARRLGGKVPTQHGIFAYPRNPAGMGYYIDIDRRRADGAPLPRIEDPGDRLTPERLFVPEPEMWIDQPVVGHIGWVAYNAFPRLGRIAGPLLRWQRARPLGEAALGDGEGLVREDLPELGKAHPRALQGAAPGLARERLRGDELIVLERLFPESPRLELELPGEVPEVSIHVAGLQPLHHSPVLQTVRIDLDRRQISLTWCVAQRMATPAPDAFLGEVGISAVF